MSEILQPTPINIEKVAIALRNGSLIGLPTETVYGLAADAENEIAVRRIYQVKGRPSNHPIIVHLGSIEYLERWAIEIPEYARKLAKVFWPGPMTLILKRSKLAKDFVTGSQDSVGIRIPSHPVALSVLKEFHRLGGNGLVAPSANKYEAVSPTDSEAVNVELGSELDSNKDIILNGGVSEIGLESTIVSCLNKRPQILRYGGVTKLEIEKNLQTNIDANNLNSSIRHSGDKSRHYAPKAKVIVDQKPSVGDGFIAMSTIATPQGCIRLAAPSTSIEFAKVLYSTFRKADLLGLKRVIVLPPRGDGIELAIQERLEKASR